MRIATWNVNSVRARLSRLVPWLEENQPDIVCLQETKVVDDLFPREFLEDQGYNCEVFGQKTYNGVAILARHGLEAVVRGFHDDDEDAREAREASTAGLLLDDLLHGLDVLLHRLDYGLRRLLPFPDERGALRGADEGSVLLRHASR